AVGDAVFVQVGALAVAQLADDQQIRAGPHHVHGHHVVAVIQAHADDAPGGPAHGPHRVLGEAHGLALGGDQQDVLGAVGQAHVHQLVVLVQVDADEAVPGAVVLGQRRLLDDALLGGHDQEVILVVLLDRDGRLDPLIPRQVDEVYDGRAPGGAPRFGNVVAFHPVHFALVAEEQDVAVGAGDKQVLDEIVVFGAGRRNAPTAPPLRPVGRGGQPLDVAEVGHGNDHVFVGDEVLFLDLVGRGHDLGSPLVAVLLLDFLQLRADDLVDQVDVAENFPQPGDGLQQLLVFFFNLLALQPRQAAQLHVQDGDGLLLRQAEALHQALLRLGVGLGRADERDDLVDVVQGNAEPFQNVGPLLGFAQLVAGAPNDHFFLMLQVVAQHLFQAQHPRLAVHQRQHDDAEGGLQLAVAVEAVQDHPGVGVPPQLDDDAHAAAVRFVPQIADALNGLVPVQLGDLLDQVGL